MFAILFNMENLEQQMARMEQKIDAIYASAEKSRKYMLTMLVGTIAMIVLPLLAAAVIVPMALSSLGAAYGI